MTISLSDATFAATVATASESQRAYWAALDAANVEDGVTSYPVTVVCDDPESFDAEAYDAYDDPTVENPTATVRTFPSREAAMAFVCEFLGTDNPRIQVWHYDGREWAWSPEEDNFRKVRLVRSQDPTARSLIDLFPGALKAREEEAELLAREHWALDMDEIEAERRMACDEVW